MATLAGMAYTVSLEVCCILMGASDVSFCYSLPYLSLLLTFFPRRNIACDDTTFVSSIVSKHTTEGYGLGRHTIA